MRLFTGKGDDGTTDLLGDRVAKNDPRVMLIGILDETTSFIGLGRAHAASDRTKAWLQEFQRDLYKIMAELAFTDEIRPESFVIGHNRVARLEELTDTLTAELNLPPEFILPGDTVPGAALDVARAVVRRAEREAVDLLEKDIISNPEIVRFLNRLSSFMFAAARHEDREAGVTPLRAKESVRNE
ncbi:MAG: cob(I)yrinic acid a,c-diamide adenosyltransferase [Thermomicrobiales bacterium]